MSDDITEPKPSGMSGKIRALLFVSLALNLLVVGLVAGALLRFQRGDTMAGPPLGDLGYGPFAQALTREQQGELRKDLVSRAGDLRDNRAEIRDDIEAFLTALRATPYDPVAVRTIAERQQERLSARQQIGQQILMDRIDAMTDHQRAEFADRLKQQLRRPLRGDRH